MKFRKDFTIGVISIRQSNKYNKTDITQLWDGD